MLDFRAKKINLWALLLVVFPLFLASCGSDEEQKEAETPDYTQYLTGDFEGTLTIPVSAEAIVLDEEIEVTISKGSSKDEYLFVDKKNKETFGSFKMYVKPVNVENSLLLSVPLQEVNGGRQLTGLDISSTIPGNGLFTYKDRAGDVINELLINVVFDNDIHRYVLTQKK